MTPPAPKPREDVDGSLAVSDRLLRPTRILTTVAAAIFLADAALLWLLRVLPPVPDGFEAVVDAALLSAVLAPILYFVVYYPLRNHVRARETAMRASQESERRFQDIAEHANEGIWEVNAAGQYTYVSPVLERMLGYTSEELLGKHFYDFFHPDDKEALTRAALRVIAEKVPFHDRITRTVSKEGMSIWLSSSGVPVLDDQGEVLGYRGADSVKHEQSSLTDLLTGLLNRRGFRLLAEQQLRLAQRNGQHAAVLFGDMDELKPINDEFGHLEGDRALQAVAAILKEALREADTIGRYGGDEFLMLVTGASSTDLGDVVLEKIRASLAAHNSSSAARYPLSISIGVATYDPEHPQTLDDLIRDSDRAMYEQKKEGARTSRRP